jgi:hypothetical protein
VLGPIAWTSAYECSFVLIVVCSEAYGGNVRISICYPFAICAVFTEAFAGVYISYYRTALRNNIQNPLVCAFVFLRKRFDSAFVSASIT